MPDEYLGPSPDQVGSGRNLSPVLRRSVMVDQFNAL